MTIRAALWHTIRTELSVDLLVTSATSLVKRRTYGTAMPRDERCLNKKEDKNIAALKDKESRTSLHPKETSAEMLFNQI